MAKIGSLTASLELQSATFIRDFGRAARAVETNTASISRHLKGAQANIQLVTRAAGALGIGLGVSQLASFAKHVIDTAGGLGELAQQMGLNTQSLQVYEAVALQAGVKTEQLGTGFAKLNDVIGDAARRNDTAVRAFDRLGIGILDAGGKLRSTEDIFQDVAKAIAAMESPAERATALADLMGQRAGSQLIPVLLELAKGYELNADKAKEMGLVLEDEVIKNLDGTSDAFARLEKRTTNVFARFLSGAIGGLQERAASFKSEVDALDRFQRGEAFDWQRKLFPSFVKPSFTPEDFVPPKRSQFDPSENTSNPIAQAETRREEAAQKMIAALELERDSVGKTKAEILAMRLARETETIETGKGVEVVQKYTDAQIAQAVAVQQQIDAHTRATEALQAYVEAEEMDRQVQEEITAIYQRRDQAILRSSDATEQIQAQAEAAGAATAEWNKLTQSYEVNDRELRVIVEQQRILNESMEVGADKARALAEAHVAANDNLKQAQQQAEQQARQSQALIDELAGFADRAFDRIGSAITAMFVEGNRGFLEWRNLGKAILSEMAQEFIKLALLNPLKNALFGSSAPTLLGAGSLFGGGSLFSSLGNAFSSVSASLFGTTFGTSSAALYNQNLALAAAGAPGAAFAEGGRPPMGVPSWVGERGKELFVPDTAGTIVPNHALSRFSPRGSDSGSTNFIDARGADREGMRRLESMLAAVNGSIERRAVAAVGDAMRRGTMPHKRAA